MTPIAFAFHFLRQRSYHTRGFPPGSCYVWSWKVWSLSNKFEKLSDCHTMTTCSEFQKHCCHNPQALFLEILFQIYLSGLMMTTNRDSVTNKDSIMKMILKSYPGALNVVSGYRNRLSNRHNFIAFLNSQILQGSLRSWAMFLLNQMCEYVLGYL